MTGTRLCQENVKIHFSRMLQKLVVKSKHGTSKMENEIGSGWRGRGGSAI